MATTNNKSRAYLHLTELVLRAYPDVVLLQSLAGLHVDAAVIGPRSPDLSLLPQCHRMLIASHPPDSWERGAEIVVHAVEIFSAAAQSVLKRCNPLVATDLIEEIPTLLAQEGTSL